MQINVGHLTEGISGHDGQALGVIKNLTDSGYNINVTTISVGWRTRPIRGLLKLVSRKYWTGTENDDVFYFEFLPKGLTTSNNEVSNVLKTGIPGYRDRVNYD